MQQTNEVPIKADVHAQFQQAISFMEQEEYAKAEIFFQEVLAKTPTHTGALVSYIKCLQLQQRRAEALPLMGLLQSLHPENLLFTLAYVEALNEVARYADAVLPLRAYLERGDWDMQAVTALANLYFKLGDTLNAAAYIHWALALETSATNKSVVATALALAADIACAKLRFEEAKKFLTRYVQACPKDLRMRLKLGDVCEKLGLLREALVQFSFVRDQEPGNSDLWTLTGRLLTELRDDQQAARVLAEAVRLNPQSALAAYHFGNFLSETGQHQQAKQYFEQSIQLDPNFARAQYNLSLCELALGHLELGFKQYHWRWNIPAHLEKVVQIPLPKWAGDVHSGLHLLIWTEQGIGDGLFFGQALNALHQLLAHHSAKMHVIFACDTRLKAIFSQSFPLFSVISHNKELLLHLMQQEPKPTHQLAIGDLLALFWQGYKLGDFPAAIQQAKKQSLALFQPYLVPCEALKTQILARQLQAFQQQTGRKPIARIGIAWHSIGQRVGASRSIPLKAFLPMIKANPTIQWVNLQYGDYTQDISRLRQKLPSQCQFFVDDAIDNWMNLDALVAQIATLDLVISIDNSTVHMAGCLGVPTWLLLGDVHNWRWPCQGDEPYWYQHMIIKRWNQKTLKQDLASWCDDLEAV